jgi:hypothetical protein
VPTTTSPPLPDHRVPRPSLPAPGARAAVRFLTGFSATLLPLVATAVALGLGWSSSAQTWPVASAVVTGWTLAAAGWLHHRSWTAGAVLAVLAAPATVLAGPAALGWLTPAGLVLWGPVGSVLAAALAMTAHPVTLTVRPEELR